MPLDAETIDEIALTSALANASIEVTGYLTLSEPNFHQYLEGPPDAVGELLEKIRKDRRHDMTHVVELGSSARRFPDWSMQLLPPLSHPASGPIETIFEVLTLSNNDSEPASSFANSLRDLVAQVSNLR